MDMIKIFFKVKPKGTIIKKIEGNRGKLGVGGSWCRTYSSLDKTIINGNSVNTKVEVDHKDGRKENERVSNTTQKLDDFQLLSKAANDVKRQIYLKCKETNKRWNAKTLQGNLFEFYNGDENYAQEVVCVGCYQYDPVEYRKTVVVRVGTMVAKEAVDAVFKKIYPEDEYR